MAITDQRLRVLSRGAHELRALTGVRFYAALLVFLSHVTTIPGMEDLAGSRLIFDSGVVGVSFFFVLSGFILTYNYGESFAGGVSAHAYRRFVWDRLTRIYPVHLLCLLLILPVAILSPNLPFDWRALPFHLLLLQCFWPLAHPSFYSYLNVPSWSVSCEWFFYLVAPGVMFLACGRGGRRVLLIGIVGVYALILGFLLARTSDYSRLYHVSWFAPSRLAEFVTGVFLGRAFLRRRVESAVGPWLQAAGIVLIVAGRIYRVDATWPFWGGLLYIPGSAIFIYGLALGGGAFARHLEMPFIGTLGVASFSFYLLQAPAIRGLKGVFLHLGWTVHTPAEFWLATTLMFCIVQSLALAICRMYEIPMRSYLRSLPSSGDTHRQDRRPSRTRTHCEPINA